MHRLFVKIDTEPSGGITRFAVKLSPQHMMRYLTTKHLRRPTKTKQVSSSHDYPLHASSSREDEQSCVCNPTDSCSQTWATQMTIEIESTETVERLEFTEASGRLIRHFQQLLRGSLYSGYGTEQIQLHIRLLISKVLLANRCEDKQVTTGEYHSPISSNAFSLSVNP